MRRTMLIALALCLGCDCSAETEAAPTGAAPTGAAETEAAETEAAPTGEAESAAAELPEDARESSLAPTGEPIGLQASPWMVDANAQRRNAEVLEVHRREAFAEAAQQWRALVDEFPDYDAARFNLACALARTDALGEARGELRIVLSHNLPRYEALLAEDEDLAPLRDDAELAQHIVGLRERYRNASSQGVPGVLRRYVAGEYDEAEDEQRPGRGDVVAGVYQHATRRFVPLIEPQRYVDESIYSGTYLMVLASPDAAGLLLVRTHFIHTHGYAEPHVTFMRPFGDASEEHQVRDPDYGQILTFEACLSEDGLRFRAENPEGWFPERRFPRGSAAHDATQASLCIRTADYNEDGVVTTQSTHPGWTLHPRSLDGPERSFPLSPRGRGEPRSVVLDSSETQAIAISHMTDDEGVLRNRVERVDLQTGEVQRLSAGHGFASARYGLDGALYVDVGPVLRFEGASSEPQETLRGLRLF